MIRIALPNKGTLRQPALDLLSEAGFAATNIKERVLRSSCEDERVEYVFVRVTDVAKCVQLDAAYAGITGLDILYETASSERQVMRLGFGNCKIVLAAPKESAIKSASDLRGMRVATAIPNLARDYFERKKIPVELSKYDGAMEIMPYLGLAEAVVDRVETGRTMEANSMRSIDTLFESTAMLIASNQRKDADEVVLKDVARALRKTIRK
jgi:ATP phosphoribosyltransferase